MSFGRPYIMGTTGCIHDGWLVLKPGKIKVDPDYLYHLLGSAPVFAQFAKRATGTTVKNLNTQIVSETEIPLPDFSEQQRIAAILDEVHALCRLRRQSLSRLSDLGQAIFFEMFGNPVINPHDWPRVPLAQCVVNADDIRCGPFGTQLLKEEFTEAGVPLWGIKQVNKGFAIPTHEFVSEAKAKTLSNYDIVPGDIVMTRKGTIGNCAVYPHDFLPGIMHSDLLRLRLDRKVCDPVFLSDQLHWSADIERQIELISGGAIMKGINVGKLKQIRVLLPPMEMQDKYVERMRAAQTEKHRMLQHLGALESLFASLQHRAFRGEL
ncbi:restriction endonuclease subunit S [Croceicoccus marinus]|uniref:Restriction endonuclease subunit S n=2 Tax=Croceicoccus marinus TaxID=450378 RepID=A0A7G6VYH0_9SPHN|nr:restriction endonuclease subunit S [Croceicoccus marinus]